MAVTAAQLDIQRTAPGLSPAGDCEPAGVPA